MSLLEPGTSLSVSIKNMLEVRKEQLIRGIINLIFKDFLVQIDTLPKLERPPQDFFVHIRGLQCVLLYHKDVNFITLREPLDVTFIFFKNKIILVAILAVIVELVAYKLLDACLELIGY